MVLKTCYFRSNSLNDYSKTGHLSVKCKKSVSAASDSCRI